MIDTTKMAVFCFPRTGSTLTMQILAQYQKLKYDIAPLPMQEFFSLKNSMNMRVYSYYAYSGDTFIPVKGRMKPDDDAALNEQLSYRLMHYVNHTKTHDVSPVSKLIYPWTPQASIELLMRNGIEIINLQRRNTIDILLSFFFATRGRFHVNKRNTHYRTEKLTLSNAFCDQWLEMYLEYKKYADTIKGPVVYYEDFESSYNDLFEALNITDYSDYITDYDFIRTRKLHEVDKMDLLTNPDEVREWASKNL